MRQQPEEPVSQSRYFHPSPTPRGGEWEPVDGFGPAALKAGQEIRLDFSTSETLALSQRLAEWHVLCSGGVAFGERILRVVDEDEVTVLTGANRAILETMLESQDNFWELLEELRPDLLTAAAATRLLRLRRGAVSAYEEHLARADWDESAWQAFFSDHTWIFGHALAYQFLSPIEAGPAYGGTGLDRVGTKLGDYLMATEARARFTVLVEIKKPQTPLLGAEYRGGAFQVSRELAGGVAQTQMASRTWVTEGSRAEANRERLETEGIETYEPKAILVLGDLQELDTLAKRRSFELFRRNLHNPEILTYDEVLERARYLVELPASGDDPEAGP